MARIDRESLLGLILAGGRSTRMQGPEKSLVEVAHRPLIRHVVERLSCQVREIAVNANGDPTRFGFLGLPVLTDEVGGFAGPLAGVHAGLSWVAENRPNLTHVLSVAADTPFFPSMLANDLCAAAQDNAIVLASSAGRLHPVVGLWPVALAADLGEFLSDPQNRKVMLFVRQHRNRQVEFAPFETTMGAVDPFFNINTPGDLDWARDVWEDVRYAN